MKAFITGGTGFVGTTLTAGLAKKGWEVSVLTRAGGRTGRSLPGVTLVEGNPLERGPWQEKLGEHDMVINLAGASLFSRWSSDYKETIRNSRVMTTRNVAEGLSARQGRKTVLLSTSAVGYYGFHEDEPLDESSPPGADFLAGLCAEWEAEAEGARRWGVRVVLCRFGIVLGARGGALGEMLPLFRKGLGSPLGNGKQWISWVHQQDLVDIHLFLAEAEGVSGPINCTAPTPVRNSELTEALAEVLGKPVWMPAVPGFMIRLLKGEVATVLVEGQKVLPTRLLKEGFEFRFPRIREALRDILADNRTVVPGQGHVRT
jgi:uncharacterized protein